MQHFMSQLAHRQCHSPCQVWLHYFLVSPHLLCVVCQMDPLYLNLVLVAVFYYLQLQIFVAKATPSPLIQCISESLSCELPIGTEIPQARNEFLIKFLFSTHCTQRSLRGVLILSAGLYNISPDENHSSDLLLYASLNGLFQETSAGLIWFVKQPGTTTTSDLHCFTFAVR